MTAVYARARDRTTGRTLTVRFDSEDVNEWGWKWELVRGSCARGETAYVPYKLGPQSKRVCDEFLVETELSSVILSTPEWEIRATAVPVYAREHGPRHRIDLAVKPLVDETQFAAKPHGLLGQSFDGSQNARIGRLDSYPDRSTSSNFTTTAMAEGAIDGVASDYEVASAFSTTFRYSRYDRGSRRKSKRPYATPTTGSEELVAKATDIEEEHQDKPVVASRRLSTRME